MRRVQPLGPPMGLLVRRESLLDRARTFFGKQDLRTGDAQFDPAFLVQAVETDRALGALDDEVRAQLLHLRALFEDVTLSDAGLSLRGSTSRVPPEELRTALETVCAVVVRVARASGAVQRGPYR